MKCGSLASSGRSFLSKFFVHVCVCVCVCMCMCVCVCVRVLIYIYIYIRVCALFDHVYITI